MQGYTGQMHGGVVSALLDAAMTHCLFHNSVEAVTGDLQVRFVRPVPCSKELTLTAWINNSHPPLHRMQADLHHKGHLLAKAKATFVQRGAS
jgi:acyl-coenzyme A thioesterase PaaI-like protein